MLIQQKLTEFTKPNLVFERLIFLIVSQPEIREGFGYGVPRRGHPEGTVLNHVMEIIRRINKLNESADVIFKLYLLAIVHDSLKYQVNRKKPKTGENNHGMRARRFLEKFISDENLLNIIELHDGYYYQWKKFNDIGFFSEKEFRKMADRLKGEMDLFMKFAFIDGTTGKKRVEPRIWLYDRLMEFGYLAKDKPVRYH